MIRVYQPLHQALTLTSPPNVALRVKSNGAKSATLSKSTPEYLAY